MYPIVLYRDKRDPPQVLCMYTYTTRIHPYTYTTIHTYHNTIYVSMYHASRIKRQTLYFSFIKKSKSRKKRVGGEGDTKQITGDGTTR